MMDINIALSVINRIHRQKQYKYTRFDKIGLIFLPRMLYPTAAQ